MKVPDTSHIEGVLFDLDGTLIDTYDIILASMQHTVRTVLGKDLSPDILLAKVGQPLAVQMRDFAANDQQAEEMLQVYRDHNEQTHDAGIKSFAGVGDALRELKRKGLKLGVVTSKRHEPALRGLRIFRLDGFFECLVGSDDCETHKPEPGPVLQGASLLGCEPVACLYVGDSPYDLQAGRAAGCLSVAALWGMFSEQVLRAENPDFILETPTDLISLFA